MFFHNIHYMYVYSIVKDLILCKRNKKGFTFCYFIPTILLLIIYRGMIQSDLYLNVLLS